MSETIGGATETPSLMSFQVVVQPRITIVAVMGNERRPVLELSRNTAGAMIEQLQTAINWYDQLNRTETVPNDTGVSQG